MTITRTRAAGAAVAALAVATSPVAFASATETQPEPGEFVTVAWRTPLTPAEFAAAEAEDLTDDLIWPQSYVTSVETATSDLDALDAQLTDCGTYQVDAYVNGPGPAALIAGGTLTGPAADRDYLVRPRQSGTAWKIVTVEDCTPETTTTTEAPPTTTTAPPTTTTTTTPPTPTTPTTYTIPPEPFDCTTATPEEADEAGCDTTEVVVLIPPATLEREPEPAPAAVAAPAFTG